tara:strand:- start:406 stop:642 length:237 start_codon:yes stop_codon:yes gene_type:complete
MDQQTRDFLSERFNLSIAKMRAREADLTPEQRARELEQAEIEMVRIKRQAGAYIEQIMVGQAQAYQKIKHHRYRGMVA